MSLDRRSFLRGSAALAAWSAAPLARPFAARAAGRARRSEGYGPLAPVLDDATGLPLLRLPGGFRYVSFGWARDPMTDGQPTPPGHDGSAVFPGRNGTLVYLRNHELHLHPMISLRRSFAPPERTYDPGDAPGGVTAVTFDPGTGRVLATEPRLSGTLRNCGGGPTPWGTWLTCEETLDDPSVSDEGALLARTHGWVFEVAPTGPVRTEPIRGLGRMWHEAAAVDPGPGIVYETEDRPASGLYRFVPDETGRQGSLHHGGRLEALAVHGAPGLDTGEGLPVGEWMGVTWVPVPDPERCHASPEMRDGSGLFAQAREGGAASFRRGEGAWFGGGRLYFSATAGGARGAGQIFELDPADSRLRLIFESPDRELMDSPDNVAVSPRGGLVICEDAVGAQAYLRGLTPDGAIFDLACNDVVLDGQRNALRGDFSQREWTGACFSPDGRWLFANVQWPGISFAITGPWERGIL